MRKTKRLTTDELAPYLLPDELRRLGSEPLRPLDWSVLFGNVQPVEIEVGCGKGLFLINAAAANSDVNFLGIEIVRKYQLYTATRVALRELPNVRVACADAKLLLRDRVPERSLQAVHVYYPDPWWKKRHHKRRLFTVEFVDLVATRLRPGGNLHVATDVAEYFDTIQELCRAHSRLRELPPPLTTEPRHDMDYLTNFERKARQQDKPVFRAQYEAV